MADMKRDVAQQTADLLREHHGSLTQNVADEIGVTRRTLFNWETDGLATVKLLDRALKTIGYELKIVRARQHRFPKRWLESKGAFR